MATPIGGFVNSAYPPGYRGQGAYIRGTGSLDLDPFPYGASYKIPGARTAEQAQAFLSGTQTGVAGWWGALESKHRQALILIGISLIIWAFFHFIMTSAEARAFHKALAPGMVGTALARGTAGV